MDTDAAVIAAMKADIRYHDDAYNRWNCALHARIAKKKTKDYKRRSSELYHYLIGYYGVTAGKQKWAAHIRRLNSELVHFRRLRKEHQQEAAKLRGALAVYTSKFIARK